MSLKICIWMCVCVCVRARARPRARVHALISIFLSRSLARSLSCVRACARGPYLRGLQSVLSSHKKVVSCDCIKRAKDEQELSAFCLAAIRIYCKQP